MGIVYLGVDSQFTVAVKTINPALNEDPAVVERFRREIETLGKIDSEFVARLRGSDLSSDLKWMAVEHINSPNLKSIVEKRGAIFDKEFWQIARSLLLALADIHSVGVVHRDIKPENILFADKSLKVIDFGIAQEMDATSVTTAGVSGSPAWLSPEQIEGDNVSAPSDIFSAGAVLHFVATGKNPWIKDQGVATGAVFNKILQATPDLSELSDNKRTLISKMLSKSANQRGTAKSLLTLLVKLQQSDVVAEAPVRSKVSFNLKKFAAVASVIGVIAAGLTFGFGQAAKADYICAETIYSEIDHAQDSAESLSSLDFTDALSSECQTTDNAEQLFDVESCVFMDSTNMPFGVLVSREVTENTSTEKSRKWNQLTDRYGCRTLVQLGLLTPEESTKLTLGYNQRLAAADSVSAVGSESYTVSSDGRGGSFVTRFRATNTAGEPHYLFVPEFAPVGIQLTWIDGVKPVWAASDSIESSFKVTGINVVSQFCWTDEQLSEIDASGKNMGYEFTSDGVRWVKVESSYRDVSCGDGLTQRLVTLPAKVISKDMKYGTCLAYSLVVPETTREPASRMAFCVIAGNPKN